MATFGLGGGGADFANLENHIAVAGNLASSWTASTQVLTISGTTFTGNNIAGASDVTINAVTNGQILIRSGNAFVNATVTGSGSVTVSATAGALNISGTQLSISAGENISATVTNNIATISATNTDTLRGMSDTQIDSISSGHIIIWNGNDFQNRSLQGDATLSTNGTITIGAKKVTLSKIDGGTSSGFLFTDASGNLTASAVTQGGGGSSFTRANIIAGTNITLSNSGTDNVVISAANTGGGGGTSTLSGATDTEITSLQNGDFLVYNTTDSAWINLELYGDVTANGDGQVTISNSAVTAVKISSNAVTSAKISAKAVTLAKINGGSTVGFLATTSTNGNVGIATITGGDNITVTKSGASVTISGSSGGATTLSGLSDVANTTPTTGQVLKFNGTVWGPGTDNTGGGGGGSLTAGDGINITNGVISTDESVTRIIDFGNDTTDNIASGKFVSILDGLDGNGVLAGEEADTSAKIPVGISVKAINGKANSGADALETKQSVFVAGAFKPPASMLEGSFTGAVDKQAVFLVWVTNVWKLTLAKTPWLVATHHNGTMIFDFEAMHNVQDRANQIVDTVDEIGNAVISDTEDSVLMSDNGVMKKMGWKEFEADVEPIHTKESLTLSGYVYSSQDPNNHALVAGEFHLRATDLDNVQLLGVAKAGDEAQFRALMTPGFQLEIETGTGNNRTWVVGVVGTSAVAGNAAQVNFVAGSVTKSTTNFSNDQALTFNSYGRTLNWRNVEYTRDPTSGNGFSSRFMASTQWVENRISDRRATIDQVRSNNATQLLTPAINATYFQTANASMSVTVNSVITAAGVGTENRIYYNNGIYLMHLSDTNYSSVAQFLYTTGNGIIVKVGGDIVFRGVFVLISKDPTTGNISFRLGDTWEKSTTWRSAATSNVTIEFVGFVRYQSDNRYRFLTQTCFGNFGRCENISSTSNTRFASTFTRGSGSARMGRYGPINAAQGGSVTNFIRNNTQMAKLSNHLGFYAKAGENYIVTIGCGGVFNFNSLSWSSAAGGTNYGIDMGLQYRVTAATATPASTYTGFTVCSKANSSQGGVNYRFSHFSAADNGGNVLGMRDTETGTSQAAGFFKGKLTLGSAGANIDAAFPAITSFVVGPTADAAFQTGSSDVLIEFDPIYCCAEGDDNQGLGNAYSMNAKLQAVQEL